MVNMETVEELAESIADSVGVYGCGCSDTDANGFENHPDTCNCRICFVESMKERIVQAVHNDVFLSNVKEMSKLTKESDKK